MRLVGLEDRAATGSSAGAALVLAAIRGERDAQRQVWEDHRRWVAAVLMAHKPRQADLEDLLQDVAMQFVRRVNEIRDPGALKPWLRTVAVNAAHASGRTLKRRRRDETEHRPASTSGALGLATGAGAPADAKPDLLTGRREEARRLMELSERLPDGYREPLLLRCLQGMSYRMIGELMGLPETTIETRIARGRRMLRELAEQTPSQTHPTGHTIERKPDGATQDPHAPQPHARTPHENAEPTP
ncbi:MAG: sigma-70 family RNA polymerase sigma factor [Phycisphaeraceae bacterium]|nr:sigma-70 family RNA polymerase sigma factor [Phycisphaeraceae bacterium]MBX3367619.1 sigma-70 family RNA polymerase sigma factor [Phycisphaeraceae bacterium]